MKHLAGCASNIGASLWRRARGAKYSSALKARRRHQASENEITSFQAMSFSAWLRAARQMSLIASSKPHNIIAHAVRIGAAKRHQHTQAAASRASRDSARGASKHRRRIALVESNQPLVNAPLCLAGGGGGGIRNAQNASIIRRGGTRLRRRSRHRRSSLRRSASSASPLERRHLLKALISTSTRASGK